MYSKPFITSTRNYSARWESLWWGDKSRFCDWVYNCYIPISYPKSTNFISRALAGYNANGQKNGWPQADPTDDDTLSALYNSGIQTPGVVNIPVCSVSTAWANWVDASNVANEPFFPCNEVAKS